MTDVILTTTEYPGLTKCGGIGAAVEETLEILRTADLEVEVVIVVPNRAALLKEHQAGNEERNHISFVFSEDFSNGPASNEAKSYAVFQYLKTKTCKKIIFPDYAGLGFYSMLAKKQALHFHNTELLLAVHGPTEWALSLNAQPIPSIDAMVACYIEKKCFSLADHVVYLSKYIRKWVEKNLEIPSDHKNTVIPNLMRIQDEKINPRMKRTLKRVEKIIFFGRHELRKNLTLFADAILLLAKDEDIVRSAEFVFLGDFGTVNGLPSEIYLYQRLRHTQLKLTFLPGFNRTEAEIYLRNAKTAAVIIPSIENCPYTVLESVAKGLPLYVCDVGGSKELLNPKHHCTNVFENNRESLANCIRSILISGGVVPDFSNAVKSAKQEWIKILKAKVPEKEIKKKRPPLVTLIVVTHNRPEKAIEALNSCLQQTYDKKEIILIDDGSDRTTQQYIELKQFCADSAIKLVETENRYLGAARNRGYRESKGQFIIFLDDDDLLMKGTVARLVRAAIESDADILPTLSFYMDASQRGLAHLDDVNIGKVEYLPTGGPLAAGVVRNCFGPSVSLIARRVFEQGHLYTEEYGVGHEDYEFYIRAVQAGFNLLVHPVPSFYYEVGVPSMISQTPIWKNFNRTFTAFDNEQRAKPFIELTGILLSQTINGHLKNNQSNFADLPTPLAQIYHRIDEVDAQNRLKLLFKYSEFFGSDGFKENAIRSLKERTKFIQTLGGSNAKLENVLPPKNKIPTLVNRMNSKRPEKAKEYISAIGERFDDLCKKSLVTNADVDYLFKALALSRSATLAKQVTDNIDLLSDVVKDQRRLLALGSTSYYLLGQRDKFKERFLTLLDGEANDFKAMEINYKEMNAIDVFLSVVSAPGMPSWAFQFTRVTGACLGKKPIGNKEAVVLLHKFATDEALQPI